MGKKKADARRPAATSYAGPPPPPAESTASQHGGGSGYRRSSEPGLQVHRQPGGILYLSGLTAGIVALALTQLALAPTLPQLLCHWTWSVLTSFGAMLVGCRWAHEEEVAAHLIFWGLLMVNGLCWLPLLLVPAVGVPPGTLWLAFGEHGGDHLALGSLGSVPLLVVPPALMLGFMWFERKFLSIIYHDVFVAMGGPFSNVLWQLTSPALPFAMWMAGLRHPLFSDLPQWPGALTVIAAAAIANTPPLAYIYWETRLIRGPAHWFGGGTAAVCLSYGSGNQMGLAF